MTKQLHGVNLGGWLILEKWLTPSIFAGIDAHDEYSFMQRSNAKKLIEKHRETFITEKDFKWLHKNNINLLRIPIGYWLLEAADGYTPTITYLDKAMKWAEKYSLNVLIDFHGAKGSQNGFDNSGKSGNPDWFKVRFAQRETIELLAKIAERYKDSPVLWGIELLNEPKPGWHYFSLLRFYRKAYNKLRNVLRPGTYVIYHDAFQPLLFAGSLWVRKSHPVMMDIHWYGFSIGGNSVEKYIRRSAYLRNVMLSLFQLWQPILIGEWSTVMPQRFFDAVPLSQHMEILRKNASMQQNIYRKAAGSIYWNYKAEGDGMWNFRSLVEHGVIDTTFFR